MLRQEENGRICIYKYNYLHPEASKSGGTDYDIKKNNQ